MASQWRIRHKLMLGLVLVVGIMALLLGGTLRGLWAYWITVNDIKYKQAELIHAVELKEAVAELVRALKASDGKISAINVAITATHEKVDACRAQLDETKRQGYAEAVRDEDARGRLDVLNKLLAVVEKWLHSLEIEPTMKAMAGTRDFQEDHLEKLGDTPKTMEDAARDIVSTIVQDLDDLISGARRHYQVPLTVIVPASVVGLLLVCGLMRAVYAWVVNPLRALEAGVIRVAQGDFDHCITLKTGDEMQDLAEVFNDMTQRLQALYNDLARQVNERSRQLVRSEKLASVGFLAAGVAHEINNPLASIAFCSEALEARLSSLMRLLPTSAQKGDDLEVFLRYLKMIQEEAFRCKTITEKLLDFSRNGEKRREATDLSQLIQSVLDITQHLQNSKGKQIVFESQAERILGGRITAPVNAEEIKSVVLNLVVNALDSMEDGGKLLIRLSLRDGMAQMQFSDTGCGMSQEVLENIFEPFFTRSRTGKGTGLGLTISHRIINQHGGEIEAASPGPNQGSTFTVRLPIQITESVGNLPLAA